MTGILIRFLLAGAAATMLQYLVLITLVELASANAVWASATGFVSGAILNYAINYKYTYDSDLPHSSSFPKFAVTAAIGLTINTTSMYVLFEKAQIFYVVSQILATILTLIWNFIVNTFWSFRRR